LFKQLKYKKVKNPVILKKISQIRIMNFGINLIQRVGE